MTATEHNIQVYRNQLIEEFKNVEKGTERYFSLKKVLTQKTTRND
jgi:hypothetical protein